MFGLYNSLIGYPPAQRNENFSGSDTLEHYLENLKTKPDDWYYRNRPISYNRNTNGHRCKEISDIDFDNYILTTGCSHTEGIGLELEKTYPYVLSQNINCDYYNLGLGGAGVDVMIHNLTVWLNTYKKPKALIVQWPTSVRFIRASGDPYKINFTEPVTKEGNLITVGPWTDDDAETDVLVSGDYIHYFKTVELLAKIKLESFDIPQVHLMIEAQPQPEFFTKKYVRFFGIDVARDEHNGINSHATLATKVHQKLIDDYQLY
jgi:hypothetical protein